MLLALSKYIPFVQSFGKYNCEAHKEAAKKFLLLWGASALPLILAAGHEPIIQNENIIISYIGNLWDAFTGTEPFIYTVSFITPIFLLYLERYKIYAKHSHSSKRSTKGLKPLLPDLNYIVIVSLFVFLFTAMAYAHSKTVQPCASRTIIDPIYQNSSFVVYLYSLICWYFVILDGVDLKSLGFIEMGRKEESEFSEDLKARLANRKEQE